MSAVVDNPERVRTISVHTLVRRHWVDNQRNQHLYNVVQKITELFSALSVFGKFNQLSESHDLDPEI